MLIKSKNKLNDNQLKYFNDDVNIHTNVVIEDYGHYSSEKYGKLVKIDELNKNIKKMDISEQLVLKKRLNKNETYEEIILGIGLVSLIVGFLLLTGLALANESVREKMMDILGGVILVLGMVVGIHMIFRFEKRIEEMRKKMRELGKKDIVLDAKGNPVSEIWFLYHNFKFENDEQKKLFLQNNYKRLNKTLCVSVSRYRGEGDVQEDYLKSILESNHESLVTNLHRVIVVQN